MYFFGGGVLFAFGATQLNNPLPAQGRDKEDAIVWMVLGALAAVLGTVYSALIAFGGHRFKTLKSTARPMVSSGVMSAKS